MRAESKGFGRFSGAHTARTEHDSASGGGTKRGTLSASEIVSRARPAEAIKIGIYFLIEHGRVMYVGQTTDLQSRLASHRWRGFDSWAWIPAEAEELNALERDYIDALLPPWNTDSRTRRIRRDDREIRLEPAPELSWPRLSPEQLAGWDEYRKATYGEDEVWAERMRRLRAKKADPSIRLEDFGPMPRRGDPKPIPAE